MGLLSSLFGKKAAEELGSLVKNMTEGLNLSGENKPSAAEAAPAQSTAPVSSAPEQADGPSGFSWGPVMPDEPNQYNFSGTFEQYFTKIFQEHFSAYALEMERSDNGKKLLYTFRSGVSTALIVEILPKSTSVYKVRQECQAKGIPYLRFYHDYDGWWNTEAYVIQRVSKALGL